MKYLSSLLLIFVSAFSTTLSAQNDTLKIMHYNLLFFGQECGSVNISDKYDWLGVILEHAQPDIMTVNELGPSILLGNAIINSSYDYTNVIAQGDLTNEAESNLVNQIFYRTDKFGYVGVEVIGGAIRDINVYTLYTLASAQPGSDTTFFHCIVGHLKAGNTTSDQSQRTNAAASIISWVDQHGGSNENILLLGDLNVKTASQTAFQVLINPIDPTNRFRDPVNKQTGWAGSGNAIYHTQSTRSSSIDCGATGGLDDRFDFILVNDAVMDGSQGMRYVPGSYHALGNDGSSYNTELNCSGNTSVPSLVCTRLRLMSDHLPVIAEFAFESSVGIRPEKIPGLRVVVAPHPFGEHLTLHLRNDQASLSQYNFRMLDLMGKQVLPTQKIASTGRTELNTSRLATGLYLLEIRDVQGRTWREKVVKR